ncbi:MAG TPA: 4-hydroxythreonine-4-phosphate dehydrogenase PdxA [Polyangiaceae bacterium]
MIVISTGCPAGIGPEISVLAASELKEPCVLVGDMECLVEAAQLVGVNPKRLVAYSDQYGEFDLDGSDTKIARSRGTAGAGSRTRTTRRAGAKSLPIAVVDAGPRLAKKDRKPGKPNATSGIAQLAYVDVAYDLVKATPGAVLVTAPVSKSVIAHSGAHGAEKFLGHTEWLEARDHADFSVMCFALERFSTSLVTTHLPISKVPRALTPERVARATVALGQLLSRTHTKAKGRPKVVVCSLNPHAGESELLGHEESTAILPGIELARQRLGKKVELVGPFGAETAYRKANNGAYDGVVAMYHDQATIPMKVLAFGDAVNVTWGLSIVRTSVDHGTGYDIAWKGKADPQGMRSAIALAARLAVRR